MPDRPPDAPSPVSDPHLPPLAPPAAPWAPPVPAVANVSAAPPAAVQMPALDPRAVAATVAAARAGHFALPTGWVPLPVDRRPLYTGRRCPDPLRGLLRAYDPAQRTYVLRTTLATRAWGYQGALVDVRVGDEVVILEDLDLERLRPLLLRPDVWVEVDIREPVLLESRLPHELDVYAYTIAANPVMVPRTA